MSYYNPSYSQTIAMSRGRGGYSPRGSFRGSRGPSRGGYSSRGFSSYNDSRGSRYPSNDRYSMPTKRYDEYRRPSPSFRDGGYHGRDHSSPDRKKPRTEGYSSRHDSSFGSSSYSSRYESSYSGRRNMAERSSSYPSHREEFRKPGGPPPSSRGRIFRGRGRSSRALRGSDRSLMPRRRILSGRSYGIIHKPMIRSRSEFIRRIKMSRLRRDIAGRPKSDSDDDEKKDSDKDENDDKEEKDESKSEEKDDKSVGEEKKKKVLVKMTCPHCKTRCYTLRGYANHLAGRSHSICMRRIALKHRRILAEMRQEQRYKQNELEKSEEDLQDKSNFCPLCKLNYRQHKSVHQASDGHKSMKKFLMPVCKVCVVSLKSPMIYENHICSIEHLKKLQNSEDISNSDESGGDEDLDNFTTIDSVGDQEDDGEEKKEEPKEVVNVGIEKIRKVESYYCDLCRMALPRTDDPEIQKILARHCKTRTHMQRYVRYKEDKDLEKKAEKLQRKETAEKEEKAKANQEENGEIKSEKDEEEIEKNPDGDDLNKTNEDDKMWDDVDKDIGDILAEAEDDEEEESSVKGKERYDRFKLSEKNKGKKGAAQPELSNGKTEEVVEEK